LDEREIRRFINGERPIGDGLLEDIAKGLRQLIIAATAAEGWIAGALNLSPPDRS